MGAGPAFARQSGLLLRVATSRPGRRARALKVSTAGIGSSPGDQSIRVAVPPAQRQEARLSRSRANQPLLA